MSKLPAVTGAVLFRALRKAGFELIRSRGSHRFLRHPDGRCTSVPVHRGETIRRGLLADTLRDCEMTKEELANLL